MKIFYKTIATTSQKGIRKQTNKLNR